MTLLFLHAVVSRAAQPAATLTLAVNDRSLVVAGVTPGASVYLFGVAREALGFDVNVQPHETELRDEDRDGKVEWTLPRPIARQSIWFAVDLSNGSYATAAPAAYHRAHKLPAIGDKFKKNTIGEIVGGGMNGWDFHCVVVRPKTDSVWRGNVISRGRLDRGNHNGSVQFSFAEFSPALATVDPAPPSLKHDDVVLIVNSFAGEFAAYRVGE
jgi:hypothetical protein